MRSVNHYSCLLFTPIILHIAKNPRGLKILQTDDTLTLSNAALTEVVQKATQCFESKHIHTAETKIPFMFDGSQVMLRSSIITTDAISQSARLSTVSILPVVSDEYVSQRARGAYVASIFKPVCAFAFSQSAQRTSPTASNSLALSSAIHLCKPGSP